MLGLPTPQKSPTNKGPSVIKLKMPNKSDVKLPVYKASNIQGIKVAPELTIRGNISQTSNDGLPAQAWNKLKINALSKAIAIAPYVGPCSIGPNSVLDFEYDESNDDDDDDIDKLDLRNAVTSTPLKPRPFVKATINVKQNNQNTDLSLDVSRHLYNNSEDVHSSQVSEIKSLRKKCLKQIDQQAKRCAQKKKEEFSQKCLESDMEINKKLAALKIELDREQLVRTQQQYIEARELILQNRPTVMLDSQRLEQNNSDHEKRLAETSGKIVLIEQKKKELEERQKQKREERKLCMDGIFEKQKEYNKRYTLIANKFRSCKDMKALNEKVYSDLQIIKQMNDLLLKLVEKSNEGKVTMQDLKSAENLVHQISTISDIFFKKVDEVNKCVEKAEEDKKNEQLEHELKAKQEEAENELKAKEQIAKEEKTKLKKAETSAKLSKGVEDCISGECLKYHLLLDRFLDDYEKKLQPILKDNSLKNFRFDCQKVVNVPVNAISPLDDLHLEDKLYKLSRLLQAQAVPLGNSLFLPTGHPLGVPFSTNLLAKKFVKQGEHVVSSKPEAAFAIAAVIVALWTDFPVFGTLLLAHFHRECPYLIPAFLPQVEGQSNENYYKMLGYQYSEDGKVESQDKFLRRMSGVMRLYAAILITPLRRSQKAEGKKHPHSVNEGWRWIAATLNLRPRSDISATLIYDFLEVAGGMLYLTYGLQFTKLLHVLCVDYFPLIEQITPDGCGGPVVRLKSFLERVVSEGRIPPPTGLLPPNFW